MRKDTTRRDFLKKGLSTAVGTGLLSSIASAEVSRLDKGGWRKNKRPNILFIMTDQQRYDALGFLSKDGLKTPHMDTLAREGTTFIRAYCPSPACGPSRASLFTGAFPAYSGHRRNSDAHHADLKLFTDYLSEHGYFNALVGKRHLHPIEDSHGFHWMRLCEAHYDTYDEAEGRLNAYFDYLSELPDAPPRDEIVRAGGRTERMGGDAAEFWLGEDWQEDTHHLTNWTGRTACDFIRDYDKESPFFLNVSYFGPHHPYTSAWPWTEAYNPDEMELPDTLTAPKDDPVFSELKGRMRQTMAKWDPSYWQRFKAQYYGYVSQIDRSIGDIIQTLKAKGEWENTWIIFSSDHGDHMGNWGLVGKADPYETSARIPLIIKSPVSHPGSQGPGQIEQCVNWIDLYGSILDMAGISGWREQGHLETRSLLPLLAGEKEHWRNETHLFFGRERDEYSMAYWKDNWKVIRLRKGGRVLYEIYDLGSDPLEKQDLYPTMKSSDLGAALVRAADEWGRGQELRFR